MPESINDLMKKSKQELLALAMGRGIEVKQYWNKQAIAEAILKGGSASR